MISKFFIESRFSIRRISKSSVRQNQISISKAYEETKQKFDISDEEGSKNFKNFEKRDFELSVDRYSILSKNQSNLKFLLCLSHAKVEFFIRKQGIASLFKIFVFLRIFTTFLLITEERKSSKKNKKKLSIRIKIEFEIKLISISINSKLNESRFQSNSKSNQF